MKDSYTKLKIYIVVVSIFFLSVCGFTIYAYIYHNDKEAMIENAKTAEQKEKEKKSSKYTKDLEFFLDADNYDYTCELMNNGQNNKSNLKSMDISGKLTFSYLTADIFSLDKNGSDYVQTGAYIIKDNNMYMTYEDYKTYTNKEPKDISPYIKVKSKAVINREDFRDAICSLFRTIRKKQENSDDEEEYTNTEQSYVYSVLNTDIQTGVEYIDNMFNSLGEQLYEINLNESFENGLRVISLNISNNSNMSLKLKIKENPGLVSEFVPEIETSDTLEGENLYIDDEDVEDETQTSVDEITDGILELTP